MLVLLLAAGLTDAVQLSEKGAPLHPHGLDASVAAAMQRPDAKCAGADTCPSEPQPIDLVEAPVASSFAEREREPQRENAPWMPWIQDTLRGLFGGGGGPPDARTTAPNVDSLAKQMTLPSTNVTDLASLAETPGEDQPSGELLLSDKVHPECLTLATKTWGGFGNVKTHCCCNPEKEYDCQCRHSECAAKGPRASYNVLKKPEDDPFCVVIPVGDYAMKKKWFSWEDDHKKGSASDWGMNKFSAIWTKELIDKDGTTNKEPWSKEEGLLKKFRTGQTQDVIWLFRGPYFFLSNLYSDFWLTFEFEDNVVDGKGAMMPKEFLGNLKDHTRGSAAQFGIRDFEGDGVYPSTEHAFQAGKFKDPRERELFNVIKSPKKSAKMGQPKGVPLDEMVNKAHADLAKLATVLQCTGIQVPAADQIEKALDDEKMKAIAGAQGKKELAEFVKDLDIALESLLTGWVGQIKADSEQPLAQLKADLQAAASDTPKVAAALLKPDYVEWTGVEDLKACLRIAKTGTTPLVSWKNTKAKRGENGACDHTKNPTKPDDMDCKEVVTLTSFMGMKEWEFIRNFAMEFFLLQKFTADNKWSKYLQQSLKDTGEKYLMEFNLYSWGGDDYWGVTAKDVRQEDGKKEKFLMGKSCLGRQLMSMRDDLKGDKLEQLEVRKGELGTALRESSAAMKALAASWKGEELLDQMEQEAKARGEVFYRDEKRKKLNEEYLDLHFAKATKAFQQLTPKCE